MSGGPPHHPHGMPANSAWNHLQIPNFFPARQPQHAHMSSEHSLLHQPTWHTPTTEPVKALPHSHLFNLEQMLNPRHSPGVDLSLTRNGNQNGELPQAPISLSVRDARQINSLPVGALEGVVDIPASPKKQAKRVDSILERLNLPSEKMAPSVIVTNANSSHDENSNSSNAVPDDDDSLDSGKSRRKRKPSKTIRLPNRELDVKSPDVVVREIEMEPVELVMRPDDLPPAEPIVETTVKPVDDDVLPVTATEQKTSLSEPPPDSMESEKVIVEPECASTNDATADERPEVLNAANADSSIAPPEVEEDLPLASDDKDEDLIPASDNEPPAHTFVAVEDELEKMFAGIAETKDAADGSDAPSTSQPFDGVTSTSNDVATGGSKASQKRGRPKGSKNGSRRSSVCNSLEITPKKKHKGSKKKPPRDDSPSKTLAAVNKALLGKNGRKISKKTDSIKDVYAYDSGSNTSSTKSKGPFVQIRGPRDSPISVNVINAPSNDDDTEKKPVKTKKFHDDSEYRHKVRSKGLHCSTLSNKYDAQTKDITWICVFCKRGPHSSEPLSSSSSSPSSFSINTKQYSPGDLFGPYIITTDCTEYQRRLNDPFDLQFKSKKAAVRVSGAKKAKRKHTDSECCEPDILEGMTEASESTYEVWTHEDCVIWSPGVYLVGPKIIGLEGAVWGACSVPCARCGMKGAAVCCLRRGCGITMHVGCARLSSWSLDEETYKPYCAQHRAP